MRSWPSHCFAIFTFLLLLGCSGGSGGGAQPTGNSKPSQPSTTEDSLKGIIGDFGGQWNSQTCTKSWPGAEPYACDMMVEVTMDKNYFFLTINSGNYTYNTDVYFTGNEINSDRMAGSIGSSAMKFEYNIYSKDEHFFSFEMVLTSPRTADVKWRRTVFNENNIPTTYDYVATVAR